jgi:hypothetical protein
MCNEPHTWRWNLKTTRVLGRASNRGTSVRGISIAVISAVVRVSAYLYHSHLPYQNCNTSDWALDLGAQSEVKS